MERLRSTYPNPGTQDETASQAQPPTRPDPAYPYRGMQAKNTMPDRPTGPDPAENSPKQHPEIRAVRAALRRWGNAPERIGLRERELEEILLEMESLLLPSGPQLAVRGAGTGQADPTLLRVLRREKMAGQCGLRQAELEAFLTAERDFCYTVDRALATLHPQEERVIRLFYRSRMFSEDIARTVAISRAQIFRIRRRAELRLAPLITGQTGDHP